MIITAVTQGWNHVMKAPQFDAQWECLRQLDLLCFTGSGIVERLAALRILRHMIKVRIYPRAPPARGIGLMNRYRSTQAYMAQNIRFPLF